ncbi:MAG: hypothetical protein B6D59_01160 [Campylobacteraceae bacterium 4484_4]|nr:MAG: hypothetical protein B6D59_01160 [Campylobacteraceae bacterium 4484_4]
MKKLTLFMTIPLCLMANTQIVKEIDAALNQLQIESAKKVSKNLRVKYDPFFISPVHKQTKMAVKRYHEVRKTISHRPVLTMILNRSAFIDGRWVKEKERIADYRVMKINKDSVVLKRKNKMITLKLPIDRHLLVTKEER